MRRRFQPRVTNNTEFELDLAPLLAVMVKLVPVLLISSAFVQIMVIETDLPQVVKEAVQHQDDANLPQITLEVSKTSGLKLTVFDQKNANSQLIKNSSGGGMDLDALYSALVEVKTRYPQVFRLALRSEKDVSYRELVQIMDSVRRTRDKSTRFPIFDSTKNQTSETDYMFPDVVFANVMES